MWKLIKKLFKQSPVLFIAVILLLGGLGTSCYFNVKQWLEDDKTIISQDSLREELVPVAKMTAYEYEFTQLMFLNDAGNPLNWNNPVTTKRFLATIDGSIPIEIDAEKIDCIPTYDTAGKLVSAHIKLPHAHYGKMSLDPDSYKKYVEDNGFLNLHQVSTDDYNNLEKEARKEQMKKLNESDALEKADQRIQDLLTSHLDSIYKNVEVTYEYLEEDSELLATSVHHTSNQLVAYLCG